MTHDVRMLQSCHPDVLCRYIDNCATRAYAQAQNSYREDIYSILKNQALKGGLIVPMPVGVMVALGSASKEVRCEKPACVELSVEQLMAVAYFLTGIKP